MWDILLLLGFFLSFVGAYFVASLGFMNALKNSVTYPKLFGFVVTFSLSFLFIFGVVFAIVESHMRFTR